MAEKKIIWIACAYEIQCSKKHLMEKAIETAINEVPLEISSFTGNGYYTIKRLKERKLIE